MVTALGKRIVRHDENFNQELQNTKKNKTEFKNTKTEMKDTLKGINSRLGDTEEHISYVKENKERYNVLYAQQGDKGLPHVPEIEGYIMDTFKNEYRDALVIQKMLTEFRNGTLAEITEDKIYADT